MREAQTQACSTGEAIVPNDEADSLTSALSKAKFPLANHAFIRQITDAVGISKFRLVPAAERYIAATRRDGHGELRIYSGYTIRFLNEEEARRVGAGADTVRESYASGGGWLVSHPEHGDLERRSPRTVKKKREAEKCPSNCGYELSLTGKCPNCDDE